MNVNFKAKTKHKKIRAALISLAIMIVTAGAAYWVYDEYLLKIKHVEIDNAVAHYSFDYPNIKYKYHNSGVLEFGGYPSTQTALYAKWDKMPVSQDSSKNSLGLVAACPAAIGMDVYHPSQVDERNVKEQMEFILGKKSERASFELLELSQITISGIEAEQAIYYDAPFGFMGIGKEYFRDIYFDYNGYIWLIYMESELSIVDTVKEDFEFVIGTFKILE